MPSPYDVLGVGPEADQGALERAYRARLKETHPDHGGIPEEFRAVRAAYQAITDPTQPWPPDGGGGLADVPRRPVTTVEYLDYEVLADHGWSLEDEDLFEHADEAELDAGDRGVFEVEPTESLLEAAEEHGFTWPYACRGGACANCAVAVLDGDLEMPVNHILQSARLDDRFQLSCVGAPTSAELKVVFNVKGLPGLDELRLPTHRFELAQQASD